MAYNEMYELQNDIVAELESLRRESNNARQKNGILVVQNKLLPKLLEKRMQRDMPNVPQATKSQLLDNIKDFIYLGKEKGYFKDSNIIDVLKQLTCGLSKFSTLPESATFGTWAGSRGCGSLALNVNKEKNFLRHIVFHELAHCLTPDLGLISASTVISRKPGHSGEGFRSKTNGFVRKSGYEFGWNGKEITFLRECIAESMACELDGMYKPERRPINHNIPDVTSDWVTPYNRTYQQMGDEFLQTLSFINTSENDTDRKRFKALTIMALDSNNKIAKQIDEEYNKKNPNSGSKDLENITTGLSNLLDRTSITEKEVTELRKQMDLYKEKPRLTIIRRSDTDIDIEANFGDIERKILELFDSLSEETKRSFLEQLQKDKEDRIRE